MSVLSLQLNDPRHVIASGKAVSNPAAAYNKKQREFTSYVLPRSAPASTMFASGGGEVIFDLPHSAVDELDMLYLCFKITNNNGSAGGLSPLDGYSMIDSVELQNRGVPVQTQYGQALRKIMILSTPTEKAGMILKPANLNPTTFVPLNTVADGASLTFRIAIPTMLNTTNVPMWREENQWRLVFRFKGSTDVVLSTTTATAAQIGLSEMKLMLDGIQFQEDVRALMDKELEALGDVHYRYLEGSRDALTIGSTVDGTVTQQNYQQNGHLSFCFLDLRSTTGTNQTQYVPLDLDTFELMQNGRVVSHGLGDNAWTYEISKLHAGSHWGNPQLLDTHNVCMICFSDHPDDSISSGANHGFYKLTGQSEVFRFTPGNSGTNALWVFGFWHSYMKCNYKTKEIRIERKPVEL